MNAIRSSIHLLLGCLLIHAAAAATTTTTTSPTTLPTTAPTTFVVGINTTMALPSVTTSPAPAAVHVSALNLLVQPTDWLDEHDQWSFGETSADRQYATDPISRQTIDLSTGQSGPVAAYLYDTPGTYTITLTRTARDNTTYTYTVQVIVPAPTRRVYYISTAGNDSNAGTSPDRALLTAGAASRRVADHTEFRFERGGTFDIDCEFALKHRDIVLDCYGDPTQPLPTIHRVPGRGIAPPTTAPAHQFDTPEPYAGPIFNTWPGQTFDVTVRHLRFDSPYAIAYTQGGYAYHAPVAYFAGLRGRNVTIADCQFVNVYEGPAGDPALSGALFLRNAQVDPLGIPSRTLWLEGCDVVALANVALNSTNESPVRAAATGIVRGSIAFNDIAQQLDPQHDRGGAKAGATLRTLCDVRVYRNRLTDSELSFDPHTAEAQDLRIAVEQNSITNSLLRVRPNNRHAVYRDNVITIAGGPCICVTAGDGTSEWLENVRLENNRGSGWLANGRMFMIDSCPPGAMRNCSIDPARNPYTKLAPPPATTTSQPAKK
jgi:hypothetical protein